MLPFGSMNAFTPTTASTFSSASVFAGSLRSTVPALIPRLPAREPSQSTLFSSSAFAGDKPALITAWPGDRLVQLQLISQNASSPKVSKRKVFLPSSIICWACRPISHRSYPAWRLSFPMCRPVVSAEKAFEPHSSAQR